MASRKRPSSRAVVQGDMFDLDRGAPPAGWTPHALPELQGERRIRLDFETDGLQWWERDRPVGFAYYLAESGRRGYVSWAQKGGGNGTTEDQAREWLRRELRGVHIDNANTKFDLHMARAFGADLCEQGCTFGDVAHRAALLDDHRFRFGVDQLAKDFLGEDEGKYDLQLRDKGNLHMLPAWAVDPYAVQDVVLVHRLCDAMDPMIDEQGLNEVHALEQRVIPVVVEMEKNGCLLDLELLDLWTQEARREYEQALFDIYRDTGVMIASPDTRKDIERVWRARGIPITALTDSGAPSFTQDVVKRAAQHDATIAKLLYAGYLADLDSKYLGKYSKTVRRSDGWIRFNLHQLRMGRDDNDKYGTVSGRFSSAGDDFGGFNVQQVVSPKKQKDKDWCPKYLVRNLFKPAKGTEWLAVDADQIEYRIFAHFANDPEILASYAPVPGMSTEEMRRAKVGPFTDYHDKVQGILQRAKPDIKRKHTKITNFCKLFGAQLIKFAWTLETISDSQFKELEDKYAIGRWQKAPRGARERSIREEPCLQEAREIYDTYDQTFPAAKETLDLAKSTARERGWVKTIKGRRARFPGKQRTHSALNRVVQGTAADINKVVLCEVYDRRKELELTLRMTVHDELDADMANPSKIERIEEVFNHQYVPLSVPILWSVEHGPSWGEAKAKA